MKEQSISYYDDYVDDEYVVKEGEGFFSPFTFLCSVLVLSLFGFIALLSSTMDKAIMEGVPFYSYLGKELLGAALGLGLGILTYIVPDNVLNKLHFVTCPISIVLLTLSKFVQELSFLSFSGGVFSLITLFYFIAWSVPFVMEKERKGFPLLAIIPFFILYLSFIGYTAGLGWYVVGLVIIIAATSQFEAGKGSLFFFFLTGLVILVLLSIIPSVFNGISSSILPVNDMSLYNKDLLVSRMAIIDGGMSGSGLGQGLYKLEAFETPHKEFIFATIFEETGLIGLSLILVPSIIILIVGIRTANRARSNKELSVSATVIGGVSLIVFAVLLNILRVMGFNPFGGLCLPFFSYDPLSEGAFVFLSVILYRLIYREGRQKDDKE
ncbi:MAG: FtsW/RodA/SpoVE family cell cycle protein [Spirochaetales bacterium]|nr:FtsW/RodA/SpoVE family cell cycle protein [Spirochaetales bacterium]